MSARQKMYDDLAPMADVLREMGQPIDLAAVIAALEPPADQDCD